MLRIRIIYWRAHLLNDVCVLCAFFVQPSAIFRQLIEYIQCTSYARVFGTSMVEEYEQIADPTERPEDQDDDLGKN